MQFCYKILTRNCHRKRHEIIRFYIEILPDYRVIKICKHLHYFPIYQSSERQHFVKIMLLELAVDFLQFNFVKSNNAHIFTSLFCVSRVSPFLNQAVCNYVKDHGDWGKDKECYLSLIDVPTRHKLRELTTVKIGTLIRISGQVVRTHPVHPELVLGTFLCLDCNTIIKNIEQQFKVN